MRSDRKAEGQAVDTYEKYADKKVTVTDLQYRGGILRYGLIFGSAGGRKSFEVLTVFHGVPKNSTDDAFHR